MTSRIATPKSRKSIREFTNAIRSVLGLDNKFEFPIVLFLEHVLPDLFEDFCLEILPDEEMQGCDGETIPELNLIRIKESVYNGAISDNPRDRFTLAHEIGHLFLHKPGSVSYARTDKKEKIKPYQDPEWQANAFAAELLIPIGLISGLSTSEVADKCKVSYTAANIQLKYVN